MQSIFSLPYLDCILQYFNKYHPYHFNIEYYSKAFESFKYFVPVLSILSISNFNFVSYGSSAYK